MVMHLVPPEAAGGAGAPLLGSVERLVRAAEAAGVTIALENTAGPSALDEVLRRFPSPRLGLCYDSSHDWLRAPDRAGLLGRWGERLVSVHLSDNDGQEDRHWVPGRGVVDWDLVAARFPARTASGCLTLEVYPDAREPRPEPAAFLAEARASVERVREQIARR
jgi:sugar phosphate isomerase/epimerase